MSIAALKSDLEQNIKDLADRPIESFGEVKSWLLDTLLPWLDNAVGEMDEMDGAIADVIDQTEDILQPETAGIFATVIIGARETLAELRNRLGKSPNDQMWRAKLDQLEKICVVADQTLSDIVVNTDAPDEVDDDEDEDDAPANGNVAEGEGGDGPH